VADSVPVPLSGNNLKANLIANPLKPVSCLSALFPLPHLGCQVAPSVPTRNSGHSFTHMLPPWSHRLVLCLCPLSPPCVYWYPGLPWETCAIGSYDFLELLLHLVYHVPWSTPVLSQLLDDSQGKSMEWNHGPGPGPGRGED
jgi:hypothetical protein